MDLRHGLFSPKVYGKRKELSPMGGIHLARPLDPPMILFVHGKSYLSPVADPEICPRGPND